MTAERRVWCSCTIIDYLKGAERARPCIEIISHMREGSHEVVTSTIAEAEVAHLGNSVPHDTAEQMIREFFGRRYVVRAPFDRFMAEHVRRLIRMRRDLTTLDAAHVATALRWRVPLLETYDGRLLALDGLEGNPPLAIREPRWDVSMGPLSDRSNA
jgi:predicted nucleic acid-binding protein